ncbi:MAG: hypothetical protein MUO52_10550 [Desulfobacterales bacterium]|nr:hypothetical protein [Desulfobacterales bacterium]
MTVERGLGLGVGAASVPPELRQPRPPARRAYALEGGLPCVPPETRQAL